MLCAEVACTLWHHGMCWYATTAVVLLLLHVRNQHAHMFNCTQVWDFSASADARDTEGGASKRSLLEQVEKMRTYLAAAEQAQQRQGSSGDSAAVAAQQ